MSEPVIFADGDPWRDLTSELSDAGRTTVVTRRGTAVLLDLNRSDPQYVRVPLEGGNQMPYFDSGWLPIAGSVPTLTPCGLVLDHRHFWYRSTPVRLVLRGLHPRWAVDGPYGPPILEAIMTGHPPTSPGHPLEPCAAYYCARKACRSGPPYRRPSAAPGQE